MKECNFGLHLFHQDS